MKNVRSGFTFTMVAAITCVLFFATRPRSGICPEQSRQGPPGPREGYSQDLDLMIAKEVDVMTGLLKSAGFGGGYS